MPDSSNFATYRSMAEIFKRFCKKFTDRPAFSSLNVMLGYTELNRLFAAFAAYLQEQTGLQPGDCIVVQMPNVLQYPIAVFGVSRAGLVMVNTNPLYTTREMCHQSRSAGVRALVYLNVFDKLVEEVLLDTRIEYLIETRMGDLLLALKGRLVNGVVESVRRTVPDYCLSQALPFKQALKQNQGHALQPIGVGPEDVAVLQYVGDTARVLKGAVFIHGDLIASMLQVHAQFSQLGKGGLSLMKEAQEVMITPLPLYHIYVLTASCMYMMVNGNHNVLIANPHDIPGFIEELKRWRFSALLSLSTLFVALMERPGFKDVDFSNLKLTNSSGTVLVSATAEHQKGITGYTVVEGYGPTECLPAITINPYSERVRSDVVEIPIVGTALKAIDEQDDELLVGERGELCVKDSQVMKGYWQRLEAIEEALDAEGWLRTGGITVIGEDDFMRVVDHKEDLILVSGFDVYPNETEDVVMAHPKVANCAAVGIPDEKFSGAVELLAVARDPDLSIEELKAYCKENLTGYKIPRQIIFKDALLMTPMDKILRRELREIT